MDLGGPRPDSLDMAPWQRDHGSTRSNSGAGWFQDPHQAVACGLSAGSQRVPAELLCYVALSPLLFSGESVWHVAYLEQAMSPSRIVMLH